MMIEEATLIKDEIDVERIEYIHISCLCDLDYQHITYHPHIFDPRYIHYGVPFPITSTSTAQRYVYITIAFPFPIP